MQPTDPAHLVTTVSVTHNSTRVIGDMLGSVPRGCPVVIVDNASTDLDALKRIASPYGARIVANSKNVGFGPACNQGAAEATTEFLLFLNPDARLERDTLELLVAAARRYPAASAMNPRIVEGDGRAYFKRGSVLLSRGAQLARGWPQEDREVPVLSGAALFVRRSHFEAVGGFDSAIFLYHEDDDLSLRLKQQCGPLMFIRDAAVHHAGGASSARSPEVAALKAMHMGRSRVYAARKHGRPFAFSRALVQALAQVIAPDALLLRRKRAKQRAFLRGVLQGRRLRSGKDRADR
jgi:N-acetylglucosaminyl-diphospho-decaprenol L-rhamnosyltransferase